MHPLLTRTFYLLKPLIPRRVQLALRRRFVLRQRERYRDVWPIDERAAKKPEGWKGWPEGKQFAVVLTHDVDTQRGHDKVRQLAELEMSLGFRSSFNFVPERYRVSADLRRWLTENGFEVGVHGLCHDGKYFVSRQEFQRRAKRINRYINEWNAVGYRSPSMQHNLAWFHDLDILYDASSFDTDPFEPQPDDVCTIYPFRVTGNGSQRGYVELPYTLAQDFTLFILMREKNIDIWKRKLDWLVARGGMVLMNVHPDYLQFGTGGCDRECYPASFYEELLGYITSAYANRYWNALPREVAGCCSWGTHPHFL